MTAITTLRLLNSLLLLMISLVVFGCSSSQSTVVEPKSEIGRPVSTESTPGSAPSGVFAADSREGDAPVQQIASPAVTAAEPASSPQSQLSSPPVQNASPAGATAVPAGSPRPQVSSPPAAMSSVNEAQSTGPVTAPLTPEPPPPARKLLVGRQVTVDLGRTSGKVVVP